MGSMGADKDKPWTWIRYRKQLCSDCIAACCMMPVEVRAEDLVRLGFIDLIEFENSPKKVFKQLKKLGVVCSFREGTGLFMLTQRPNGDCYFLDPLTRRCRVYESRPDVCRKFPEEVGPKPAFCPYNRVSK